MSRINFAFTPEQKADARAALSILAGVATLETAARAYLAGKRTVTRKPVEEAADAFLRSRITEGVRRATSDWYDERLRYVVDRFGATLMDDVTRAEFRAWMNGLPHGASSKAGTARAARALWRWAIQHEPPLAVIDVTVGCNFKVSSRNAEGSTKVLTVQQCEAILGGVPADHRAAVALMLFGGVRPEEVAGEGGKPWIRWEHVNTAERILRVPAECSKIGATRVLEDLPETLWRWLPSPGALTDDVAKIQRRSVLEHIKRAAGFGGKAAPWPQDALRHTFASYAVGAFNDAGKVAHWLGHNGNPTMLHRFYRGMVTKADALKFWALRP